MTQQDSHQIHTDRNDIVLKMLKTPYFELTSHERMVLITLVHHWCPISGNCFPKDIYIATLLGTCERTVVRNVNKLRDLGYISYKRGHDGKCKLYSFDFDKILNQGG